MSRDSQEKSKLLYNNRLTGKRIAEMLMLCSFALNGRSLIALWYPALFRPRRSRSKLLAVTQESASHESRSVHQHAVPGGLQPCRTGPGNHRAGARGT